MTYGYLNLKIKKKFSKKNGSRQNLAWTYYLTIGTSLWKNFSFFLKSKMAAGGQKLNFDIISSQKSHSGLVNESLSSDSDKIQQADTTQPSEQA